MLEKTGRHWYEMRADTLADFVLPVNPYRRLFVPKLRERAFVDQRFTRFTLADESVDASLCHAVLQAFGLDNLEDRMRAALRDLYDIRMAANEE